jgi:adenine-specific DNA-methyltransferase
MADDTKLPLTSGYPTEEFLALLREEAPHVFSEAKVDWDKLRATLGESIETRSERYGLTWAGKAEAFRAVQAPSVGTLLPMSNESVNFDTSENLIIEGDNLEVLKLLQKSYHGRVKMIYIDPPYNTGNEFIYPDNYREGLDDYLRYSGQVSDEGLKQTTNTETSGRFHSKWLSMMYPRLFLARNLLRNDGVIFVSIDDNEVHNLRMLMNEVFGEENFIAQLVWEKTRKNDAKLFSVGHDYMIVYARSIATIKENKTIWREAKAGAKEIMEHYQLLRKTHGADDLAIQNALREWYASLPKMHPSKKLSRYKWVDKHGPWRDRDISWPGGGGPRYDVPHPKSGMACKVPERGWGFASWESMKRQIDLGLVVFRDDHTPCWRRSRTGLLSGRCRR